MSDADRQRWESRYRDTGARRRPPSALLTGLDDVLPHEGRALDVAGGAGRNAVWLARRGFDVTLVDISETALSFARDAASAAGVGLETLCRDLELEPLPPGPWNVIVCVDYLQRELFERFGELLAPDGVLVFVQPTRRNLERNPRPGSRHLLDDGELPALVRALSVVSYEEDWFDDRHEARLVARALRE